MADKYLNNTGLSYYHNRIKNEFASQDDLDTLSDRVDDIVSEGGEPNTINSISVNGTPVSPDAQKNVALTIPTKTSDLTNDGDGTSDFATEDYVNTNGGKIDKITVNGVEQTITNKTIALTIPTQVSDLTNDSNYQTETEVNTSISDALANNGNAYQTESDVESAINTAVASAYKYKGSVASVNDLPTGATTGDVYDVQDTGMNYAWNGTQWDALGQLIDTSVLWTSTSGQSNSLIAMTTAEIDEILNPTV